MTVAETLLVFVGAPLVVVVLLALLIFLPGGRTRARYRPGQPWEHEPIWYEPHPEHSPADAHGAPQHAIGSAERSAITAGDSHGAQSARPAGPLGGARGTW